MNECCMTILSYHNKYNKQHCNTNLKNFRISDHNGITVTLSCPLHNQKSANSLSKYADYEQFFSSYYDNIQSKNKHFDKFLVLYKQSFMKSIS